MPDWLVEEGIGEHRAARIERGRIAAARIAWTDRVQAGSVVTARLIARTAGSPRGTARTDDGEEVVVDRLPRETSEGAPLTVEITRAACDGPGRMKRAQGRLSEAAPRRVTLADSLQASGTTVTRVRRFPGTEWEELIGEALAGEIAFSGGSLLLAPTPAMTTIDIDGTLAPRALALTAVPAIAAALPRLAIGGSIGIDFPTLARKDDRRVVDGALADALTDWPHERTAMNGFGLVQIVARSDGPSLLQLAAWQRPSFVWRQLLRRAEHLEGPGVIELAIAPSLRPAADPAHCAALERRSGRAVRLRIESGLDPDAPHAQLVAHER